MNPFHALSRTDRADVLLEASAELGMRPLFIEKDYWVCMVLDILFSHPGLSPTCASAAAHPFPRYTARFSASPRT